MVVISGRLYFKATPKMDGSETPVSRIVIPQLSAVFFAEADFVFRNTAKSVPAMASDKIKNPTRIPLSTPTAPSWLMQVAIKTQWVPVMT